MYAGMYKKLQGRRILKDTPLNIIEFIKDTETEYYEGEIMDSFKIRIEDNYLYCTNISDKDKSKYKILNSDDKILKLLYLPAGRILTYKKGKDKK